MVLVSSSNSGYLLIVASTFSVQDEIAFEWMWARATLLSQTFLVSKRVVGTFATIGIGWDIRSTEQHLLATSLGETCKKTRAQKIEHGKVLSSKTNHNTWRASTN